MTRTDFTETVYAIVRRIPAGQVATYGDIAAIAGRPGAARAVGSAMRRNPDNADVPCHRVVGSDGAMHGFAFGGITTKQSKLRAEGASIRNGKVDLAASRWRPSTSS